MAVLHDYECPTHGVFEASAPRKCPFKGCEEQIERVFLKPPGFKSDRTKKADSTVNQLAIDYGMTNIKSTREGETQGSYYTRNNKPKPKDAPPEPPRNTGVIWGNAGNMNINSALNGGLARSIRGEPVGMTPQQVGVTGKGPRVSSYTADHEGLTIKK